MTTKLNYKNETGKEDPCDKCHFGPMDSMADCRNCPDVIRAYK